MRRARRQFRGFTLIEALAAIAVMMILIPVLLHGFGIAAGLAETTRQEADATALAQSQMDEIIGTQQWQQGGSSGSQRIGVTDYQWDAVVDTWQDDNTVQTLTVTVRWIHRSSQDQLKLVSIVYMPGTATQSNSALGGTLGPTLGGGGLP